MRPIFPLVLTVALVATAAPPAFPAEPQPEIKRPGATAAQAVGAVHTIRQIPEACARFEGMFTGDATQPYRFSVVRTSAQCQPRARLLDAAKARPDAASGWLLNDVIRIPSAACASQQAVVRVWRKPVTVSTPDKDGQGQARIYLEDAKQDIAAGKIAQAKIPLFAAEMKVEGKCP